MLINTGDGSVKVLNKIPTLEFTDTFLFNKRARTRLWPVRNNVPVYHASLAGESWYSGMSNKHAPAPQFGLITVLLFLNFPCLWM